MRANEFLFEVTQPWEIPPPGSEDFEASKESIRKIIQKVINDYSDALRNLLLSNKQQYLSTIADSQTIANNLNQAIFTSLINSGAGFITNDDIPALQQTFSIRIEPSRQTATTPEPPTTPSTPSAASSADISAPEPDSATNAAQPSNELLTKAQSAIKGIGPKLTQEELKSINDWLESQGKAALPSSYAQAADPTDAPVAIPTGFSLGLDPNSPPSKWNGTAWIESNGKAAPAHVQKALTKIYTQMHKAETKTESLEEAILNINKDTGELSVFPDEINDLATAATQVWYNNRAKGRLAPKVQKILNPQTSPNLGKGGNSNNFQMSSQPETSNNLDKFFTTVGEILQIDPSNKRKMYKILTDIMQNPEESKKLAMQIKDRLSL